EIEASCRIEHGSRAGHGADSGRADQGRQPDPDALRGPPRTARCRSSDAGTARRVSLGSTRGQAAQSLVVRSSVSPVVIVLSSDRLDMTIDPLDQIPSVFRRIELEFESVMSFGVFDL